MTNQQGVCKECGKIRVIFYDKKCQSCYRKFGKQFKKNGYWQYKLDVDQNKLNHTEKTICDLIVNHKCIVNELAGENGTGLCKDYIRTIRRKYLEKVIEGNEQ